MLRDLALLVGLGVAGYFGWREAYARGYVTVAPPQLPASVSRIVPAPVRRSDGAVDRISGTTERAIAFARQGGTPEGDVPLVAGIIIVESAANPMAHNTSGEDSRGLMQVQLSTARGLHDNGAIPQFDRAALGTILFDPVSNVMIGRALIAELRRSSPSGEDWVIRAYNGGPGWATKSTAAQTQTANYLERVNRAMLSVQAALTDQRGAR